MEFNFALKPLFWFVMIIEPTNYEFDWIWSVRMNDDMNIKMMM